MSADTKSLSAPVSESIGLIGLRNTATKNKLVDTIVPLWELQATAAEVPAPEAFNFTNPGAESVIGADDRVKVSPEHFQPGGKYRSIVKLFLKYENQPASAKWPIATGWLIRPDLLVTAGHCAFDWSHNMGRLVQVKCYIGYNGNQSIDDVHANVQFRQGKRVATTSEWLTAKNNRSFDVSFIQVEPFTGVTPFQFADTPASGNASMGVVGYPGDLRDEVTKEPGAHMYEMFLPNKFNLAESQWRMLEYDIDTYGGNSGSPVLRENENVSIGVHVYGGSPNSASVIGMYGNPFLDYVAAFDMHAQKVKLPGAVSTPGVQYITVPTSKTPDVVQGAVDLTGSKYGSFNIQDGFTRESRSFPQRGFQQVHARSGHGNKPLPGRPRATFNGNGFHTDHSNRIDHSVSLPTMSEEGFLDFLKQGIKIGGPIIDNVLKGGLPKALGPLGGSISALASIALSTAGHLAESGFDENDMGKAPAEGSAERAIMAEAAFQAMMKMDHQTLAEEGFFTDMWETVKRVAPVIMQVAPQVIEAATKPALQTAVKSFGQVQKNSAEGFYDGPKTTSKPRAFKSNGYNGHTHHLPARGPEAFLARFEAAASQGEEGLFDDIFSIAKTAVRTAGPVLVKVAEHGLPLLKNLLAESSFEDGLSEPTEGFHGIRERAILAEAALQAAMKARPEVLEEEGFFSTIIDVFHKVAPVVAKAAPIVIKNVIPIVSNLMGGSGHGEAFTSHSTARGAGLRTLALGTNHTQHCTQHHTQHHKSVDHALWQKLQNEHAAGEQQGEEFFPFLIPLATSVIGPALGALANKILG